MPWDDLDSEIGEMFDELQDHENPYRDDRWASLARAFQGRQAIRSRDYRTHMTRQARERDRERKREYMRHVEQWKLDMWRLCYRAANREKLAAASRERYYARVEAEGRATINAEDRARVARRKATPEGRERELANVRRRNQAWRDRIKSDPVAYEKHNERRRTRDAARRAAHSG